MKIATNMLTLSSLLICSAGAVTIAMDRGTTTGMVAVLSDSTTTDPTLASTKRAPIGSLVRWGTMNGAVSSENFVQFATTTVNNVNTTTLATVGGSIRDSITLSGTLAAIANVQVYMWVYGSASASSTVEQGLFTSTAWKPGADFATDGSATATFILGQNRPATAAAPEVSVVPIPGFQSASVSVGSIQNSTAGAVNSTGYIYKLAAVPEPTVALLGALGVFGLLRRRR